MSFKKSKQRLLRAENLYVPKVIAEDSNLTPEHRRVYALLVCIADEKGVVDLSEDEINELYILSFDKPLIVISEEDSRTRHFAGKPMIRM